MNRVTFMILIILCFFSASVLGQGPSTKDLSWRDNHLQYQGVLIDSGSQIAVTAIDLRTNMTIGEINLPIEVEELSGEPGLLIAFELQARDTGSNTQHVHKLELVLKPGANRGFQLSHSCVRELNLCWDAKGMINARQAAQLYQLSQQSAEMDSRETRLRIEEHQRNIRDINKLQDRINNDMRGDCTWEDRKRRVIGCY